MPRMQETMKSMVGARHFSCMDLKSGFWQVKMAEKSRQYTAFTVGSMGIYKFLRMPYGLCNAPATFQHLMQNCLVELNLSYALIYLDDVIVYSQTEEEHLTRLRAVFERFLENGLKLKPSKCHFFRTEISYLGHKVSAAGMEPSTEGIKAIAEMAPPKTYTGIRQFLGATGYFRRFIKGYAKIAKPLNDILSGTNSKLKGCFVRLPPSAIVAFQEQKMKCMTAPVLAFANFKEEFQLETDASGDGLGAVLLQKQGDGLYHPIAYASRGLKGGETRYHSSKLEFLALKWAITDQFWEYLQYAPFRVKTDNNPLTYVMTTPNLDAVGHRWVAALANFNFTIEYLRGADNKVADTLSRVEERLDSDSVRQLLAHINHPAEARAEVADPRLAEEHERNEQEIILQVRQLADTRQQMKNLADSHWVIAQQNEPAIKFTYQWLKRPKDDHRTLGEYLHGRVPQLEQRLYAARQKDFVEKRGMLYLKTTPSRSQEEMLVFIMPTHKRRAAIDGCHHFACHQGRDRMVSLIKERFWWPGMIQDTMKSVRNCARCVQFEACVQKPHLHPIICTEPMDLVHIDYVKMEVTVDVKEKPVVRDVLVVEDHSRATSRRT